jgi:hypothetical protein
MPMISLRDHILSLASDGKRAFPIIGAVTSAYIRALRKDPRFSSVPFDDFDLLLADERAEAEHKLVHELRGRIRVEDIEDELP